MKEKEKEIHDRLERLAQNLNAQGKLSMNDIREFAICGVRAIPEKLSSLLTDEEIAFLEEKKFTANKIREAFGIKPISKEILEQLSKPPLEEEAFETLASYIFSNAFARGHEYGQRGGLKPMEKMKEISKESTKELLNLLRYFSIELKEK